MQSLLTALSTIAALVAAVIVFAPQLTLAAPIVREHCAEGVSPAGELQVSTGWTYILWPPLYLAPLDPPGRCVRNSIFTEILIALDLRDLGTPAQQVERHVRSQLEEGYDHRIPVPR